MFMEKHSVYLPGIRLSLYYELEFEAKAVSIYIHLNLSQHYNNLAPMQ